MYCRLLVVAGVSKYPNLSEKMREKHPFAQLLTVSDEDPRPAQECLDDEIQAELSKAVRSSVGT